MSVSPPVSGRQSILHPRDKAYWIGFSVGSVCYLMYLLFLVYSYAFERLIPLVEPAYPGTSSTGVIAITTLATLLYPGAYAVFMYGGIWVARVVQAKRARHELASTPSE